MSLSWAVAADQNYRKMKKDALRLKPGGRKTAADAEICRQVLKEFSLEHLPAVWVVGDVCRDELLFEMDALALGPFET